MQRIDASIAALKAANVPVFWVGLPPQRDARQSAAAVYLNELYRTRAERAGIIFVDIWDGFVDEAGRYVLQGPDFEGQIRRLRSGDGIYFTRPGARKLAHYVEREILRSLVARADADRAAGAGAGGGDAGTRHASACWACGPADGLDRRRQRASRRRPRRGRPAAIRWRPACWCAASRSPRRPDAPTISPGRRAASRPSAKASRRKRRRQHSRRRQRRRLHRKQRRSSSRHGRRSAHRQQTPPTQQQPAQPQQQTPGAPRPKAQQQQQQPAGRGQAAGAAAQGAAARKQRQCAAPAAEHLALESVGRSAHRCARSVNRMTSAS